MRTLRHLLLGLVGVTVILAALLYFAVPPYLKSAPELRVVAEKTTQSNQEIFAWIADITRFGWRDPGGEGGRRTRDYLARQFRSFGLQVAEPEPFEVGTFAAEDWGFEISDAEKGETASVPCHYIPFSPPTGEAGIRGELVYVGDGQGIEEIDLSGRIAVFEQPARPALAPVLQRPFFLYDLDDSLADEPRVPVRNAASSPSIRCAEPPPRPGILGALQGSHTPRNVL